LSSTVTAPPPAPEPAPAVAAAGSAAADQPYRWRWVVLAVVLVAEIMDLLDSTVITIAAPTIRAELGGSTSAMQWWAAGYTLAFGVFMIVGARLGDVLGRRRVFVGGIVGFTLASAACALAPSAGVLIAMRVLQGAFGALLIPQGLGIIKAVFPPKELGGAFGAFGPAMGLAAVGGPILAGWLVAADLLGTGWRMVFLINIPMGLIGLAGALRFMPESKASRRVTLDPVGVALISGASLALIYPLVQGRELGWPAWTFGLMAAGVVLLGGFALAERRGHGSPMIEPSLLRNRAFTAGLLVGVVIFAAFSGVLLVVSLYLQLGLRFSPEHAGLTLAPMSLGVAVAAGGSFALIPRFGRHVLHAGLALVPAALVWFALTASADASSWALAPSLAVMGLGMGLIFGPMFNVILAGVRDDEVGSASGTLNAIQQLGGAAGVAVLGTIFFSVIDHGHASTTAVERTAFVAAALFVAAFALAFLLPKEARMDDAH
jgi:EmrB/QacA subfamily drug resistance transporter